MTDTYPRPSYNTGLPKEEVLEGRLIALTRENESLKADMRRYQQSGPSTPGSSPMMAAQVPGGAPPPPPSYASSSLGGRSIRGGSLSYDSDGGSIGMPGSPNGFTSPEPQAHAAGASAGGDDNTRYNQLYADYRKVMRQRDDDKAKHQKEVNSINASLRVAQLEKNTAATEKMRLEAEYAKAMQRNDALSREMHTMEAHIREQNQKLHELSQQAGQISPPPESNTPPRTGSSLSNRKTPGLQGRKMGRGGGGLGSSMTGFDTQEAQDPVKLQALVDHMQKLLQIKEAELAKYEGNGPEMYPVAVQVGLPCVSTSTQTENDKGSESCSPTGTPNARAPATQSTTLQTNTLLASSLLVTTKPLELSVMAPSLPPGFQTATSSFKPPVGGNKQSHNKSNSFSNSSNHGGSGGGGNFAELLEMPERPIASSPKWSDEPTDFFPGNSTPPLAGNSSTTSMRRSMNRSTTSSTSAASPSKSRGAPRPETSKPRSPVSSGAATLGGSRDAWGKGPPNVKKGGNSSNNGGGTNNNRGSGGGGQKKGGAGSSTL